MESALAALSAANAACAHAASINFERASFNGAFQVRKASAEEIASVDGHSHPALNEGAKLKDVLSALGGMVSGEDEASVLGSIEVESKELMGEIAEMRAQLIEVKSPNYVTARVEEETAEACQERKQEEEAETEARAGVLALKDKIAAVDAKLDHFQSAKRKREEENKNSEEENEILALERELLSQEVSIADAESVLATETNKTSKLKMQTQNGESELRLVKRALVAKRAQAEASLQSSPEYMKLVAAIGEAKVQVSAREEEQSNASRQLGELRGGLVQLTEGMSSRGHAPASALRILLKAPEPVPLQQLKTELTGHLSAVGLNKGREAQQVLEAIYSLTSSSLIHIDRKSAQQLVTPCV